MIRVLQIAWREFSSTVLTKGFIIGVLLTPVIMVVAIGGIALTRNLKGPQLTGKLAVVDRTGVAGPGIVDRFSPAAAAAEKAKVQAALAQAMDKSLEQMPIDPSQKAMARGMVEGEIDKAIAKIGRISIDLLPAGTDDATIQSVKDALGRTDIHAADKRPGLPDATIGLVIVPREAVFGKPGGGYDEIQSFWPEKVDFEIRERIHRRIGDAIVDARVVTDPRFAAAGLKAEDIRKLLSTPGAAEKVVTATGEKSSAGPLQMMIPAAFMALLLIAVMSSGQMLLTTTIEEKSSRVMEVILSAVSPLQLMLGKITGQLCVGLLILVIYSGMGIAGLIAFSMGHLVDPFAIVYMILFFLIAYFIIGSMFAAIGSAVTELREAQTLMTPVMLVVMTPWLLWLPISRAPNSAFAQVLSFIPGINPFVMVIRITGAEPPPAWQVWVSILIGVLTAAFCAWVSAKIFRVGVLMYGKPPNLRTLFRWVRMA